jgi:hypothetical protein
VGASPLLTPPEPTFQAPRWGGDCAPVWCQWGVCVLAPPTTWIKTLGRHVAPRLITVAPPPADSTGKASGAWGGSRPPLQC